MGKIALQIGSDSTCSPWLVRTQSFKPPKTEVPKLPTFPCSINHDLCTVVALLRSRLGSVPKMDMVAEVTRFAELSQSLDRGAARWLLGMVEACKAFLKARFLEFLGDHPGCPLVLQYSGDCTPTHVREYGASALSFKKRRLSGTKAVEFYVQQMFATIGLEDGSRRHTVMFADPLALQYGKSMAALMPLALACPGFKMPLTDRRIIILHQVHDRAMSNSFRNALSGAWVSVQTTPPAQSSSSAPAPEAEGTTPSSSPLLWHTSVGCACHDGHNSLRWAAQMVDDSSEIVKNVFVALACFRKGFMAATACLGEWLCEVVEATPTQSMPSLEALKPLYTSLGATGDTLNMLLRCRVHWDFSGERLVVDAAFLAEADSLQGLSSVLLEVWRFPAFSTSRWVTLGCSARVFSLAYVTGFTFLFAKMRAAGVLSDFEVSGVDKMQGAELRWCLLVGLAATIPDVFLKLMLSDSRLSLHRQRVALEVQDAFDYLEELPADTWRLLAMPYGMPAATLRDSAIRSGWIALAYLEWRVFSVLCDLPWSLLEDSPSDALRLLQQMDAPPGEAVADSVWKLLHMGHSVNDLQHALQLLHCVSWTSAFTEKQHASTAVVKKFHSELSYDIMAGRAYMHTFTPVCSDLATLDFLTLETPEHHVSGPSPTPNCSHLPLWWRSMPPELLESVHFSLCSRQNSGGGESCELLNHPHKEPLPPWPSCP